MAAVNLSPIGNQQFVYSDGSPADGSLLWTYIAGSTTPLPTFTSADGLTAQTNPVILNSLGLPTIGEIFLTSGLSYDIVWENKPIFPAIHGTILKTFEDISGINDSSATTSQWIASGITPTYISPNSFALPGDQTTALQIGRREQFITTAGTVYGNITSSVFTTLTTVTMQMDGAQVLDSGLSQVNHSILLTSPSAEPSIKTQSFQMGSAYGTFSIITAKGATIPGAATISVFGATDGDVVDISGAGWVCTSLGTALIPGHIVEGTITGSGTFTQSANLNLNNGGQNYVVAAGYKYRAVANTTSQIDVTITPNVQVPLRSYISGLIMSTAGSSATMSVGAGQRADSTNVVMINLLSQISKTTSVWAVGSGNGGLDTGTIANTTWYHFYAIRRPDTGVIDIIFSLSAAAPALPTNYTQYGYIGSQLTNGSAQWIRQYQDGGDFYFDTPVLDINGVATSATAQLTTALSIPLGIRVKAYVNVSIDGTIGNNVGYLSDPQTTSVGKTVALSNYWGPGIPCSVWSNTSRQLRRKEEGATGLLYIATLGYYNPRGQ